MTIPFGKHRGKPLKDVPDDYLCWVLDNVTQLRPTLRRAIERRLGIQANNNSSGVSVVTAVAGQWYRQLAKEFHPDKRGGNHEGMVAVNRARDLLLEMTGVQT